MRLTSLSIALAISCGPSLAGDEVVPATGTTIEFDGKVFATPIAACREMIKDNPGYTAHDAEVEANGSINCIWKRVDDGRLDNAHNTSVQLVCPGDSIPGNFAKKQCECRSFDVARNGECVRASEQEQAQTPQPQAGKPAGDPRRPAGECQQLARLKGLPLRDELVTRMRKLVQAANSQLIAQPSSAMGKGGDPALGLTANEVNFVFGGAGFKPLPGSHVEGMTDSAFNVLYGHAIERLTAGLLARDACLPKFVRHVSAAEQRQPGGSPDFVGVGAAAKIGLAIDVTTGLSAQKKARSSAKANYQFITYRRGLKVDAHGHAAPFP